MSRVRWVRDNSGLLAKRFEIAVLYKNTHAFPEAMRVVLEVNDSEWDFLSALLKRFDFVQIHPTSKPKVSADAEKKPVFHAVQLDTTGFRFNREEANER